MENMKFNNRNVHLGNNVKTGSNVKIGDNTTIYDNVTIDDNTIICNDCIIGEPTNKYYSDENYVNPPTVIGKNSLIRSHCIIYAGSTFGDSLHTGHRATIRENMKVGNHCQVGTLCDLQGNTTIGNYTKMHSNVHICEFSTIGNFVFIFPYTVFTNDPRPPSNNYKGPTIGDYSIIAVQCTILPRVVIGENCLVGANSVVNRNVESFSFVTGTPAKFISDIREIKSKDDDGPKYPWMYTFKRGMPWADSSFEDWLRENKI
jgi:acetyltransferase-like isoleucine patch superfamily enzyme